MSSFIPTIRLAVRRLRVIALLLLPCLGPNALPVSCGAANGSKPSLVQSSSSASNIAFTSSLLKFSTCCLILLAVAAVVEPGEDVDVAVVIGGAEDVVEIDGAVEEAPGQIADHRAQELVHRHRMSCRPAT